MGVHMEMDNRERSGMVGIDYLGHATSSNASIVPLINA